MGKWGDIREGEGREQRGVKMKERTGGRASERREGGEGEGGGGDRAGIWGET